MDFARKQRWIGALSCILVFAVVVVWWAVIVPRTPQFKAYKSKTRIKARLYNIDPPRGVRLISLDTLEPQPNTPWAMGIYSGVIQCDAIIAHYKEQFPRQGFTVTREREDSQKHEKMLDVSAPDYQANVRCNSQTLPYTYTILMWPNPTQSHSQGAVPR
jgi:hypothetical protein